MFGRLEGREQKGKRRGYLSLCVFGSREEKIEKKE